MFTLTENLEWSDTEEAFLQRWFTDQQFLVRAVTIIRHLEDTPREDVAYVLREQHRGKKELNTQPRKQEVLACFLKDYDYRRLECTVYREEELPGAFECPQSILESLQPTTDPQARIWRAQCWLRVQHPLQTGDRIAFALELPIPRIPAGKPFTLTWVGSQLHFTDAQGQSYHIPLWQHYPYLVLTPSLEDAREGVSDSGGK